MLWVFLGFTKVKNNSFGLVKDYEDNFLNWVQKKKIRVPS